jgi:hypothetical protein
LFECWTLILLSISIKIIINIIIFHLFEKWKKMSQNHKIFLKIWKLKFFKIKK